MAKVVLRAPRHKAVFFFALRRKFCTEWKTERKIEQQQPQQYVSSSSSTTASHRPHSTGKMRESVSATAHHTHIRAHRYVNGRNITSTEASINSLVFPLCHCHIDGDSCALVCSRKSSFINSFNLNRHVLRIELRLNVSEFDSHLSQWLVLLSPLLVRPYFFVCSAWRKKNNSMHGIAQLFLSLIPSHAIEHWSSIRTYSAGTHAIIYDEYFSHHVSLFYLYDHLHSIVRGHKDRQYYNSKVNRIKRL